MRFSCSCWQMMMMLCHYVTQTVCANERQQIRSTGFRSWEPAINVCGQKRHGDLQRCAIMAQVVLFVQSGDNIDLDRRLPTIHVIVVPCYWCTTASLHRLSNARSRAFICCDVSFCLCKAILQQKMAHGIMAYDYFAFVTFITKSDIAQFCIRFTQ